MDFTKLLDWLKLSPKYLFPIALVTGFALFSPDSILDFFGLTSLVGTYRGYIGAAFLIAFALLLTEGVLLGYHTISGRRAKSASTKSREELLQNLTREEKAILRNYTERHTKTAYFDIQNGVVGGLEAHGVIYRASNVGDVESWAYNIQPWAWDYLNKHPDMLSIP